MGTKNPKGSVSIENIDGRIRLRFRYLGKRYAINLFAYNRANLLEAKKVALQIEQDIRSCSLDLSLDKYRPGQKAAEQEPKTIIELFEGWVRDYRNMDCEKDIDYNSTRNMMRRWGRFDTRSVVRLLNAENIAPRTYNRRLTLLRAFFTWAVKSKAVPENPLEEVLPKKAKRTEKANRKPFTEYEIVRILEAFRKDSFSSDGQQVRHSHYYPFLFFMFSTGVRNAEGVGLRVKHVDLQRNCIYINEALARSLKGTNAAARVRKDTKNGKHRVIPMSEELRVVVEPLLEGKGPEDLVFKSPKGKAIDDSMFQKRIFSKVLKGLGIEHRVLYACRHTFGSRCIADGITPVMTAFLMGNNPETALRNYTHQLGLPKALPAISGNSNDAR
ncbi:site-specific integrase [Flaviaesturariibacter amylovorans]|uniref:Tyr recombinase domain-containing protein n=1 Tax=Flaviaesturariibacter amylovorans TaxID=1084520 RepID=A0ABP8H6S0_9BACT